jgi:hypothetical protein
MLDGVCEDEMSRQLARFFVGEDRLFSAVCHERRWTSVKWFALAWIVDSHFLRKRGERQHCRNAYLRERASQAGTVERCRAAGW